MNTITITKDSEQMLAQLQELLPHIESVFLLETALNLTLNLYEKAEIGAVIEVKYPDGKVEELRFSVKKSVKKKA